MILLIFYFVIIGVQFISSKKSSFTQTKNSNTSWNFVKYYELSHHNFSECEILCQKDQHCMAWRLIPIQQYSNINHRRDYLNSTTEDYTSKHSNDDPHISNNNDNNTIDSRTKSNNSNNIDHSNKYDCFLQSKSMMNIIQSFPYLFKESNHPNHTIISLHGTKVQAHSNHQQLVDIIHSNTIYDRNDDLMGIGIDAATNIEVKTLITSPIAVGASTTLNFPEHFVQGIYTYYITAI